MHTQYSVHMTEQKWQCTNKYCRCLIKKSYQAYYKLTCDVLLQSILHIINERFSIFLFIITRPPPPPQHPPQLVKKKNLLEREMVINIKCNKLAQAVPVEICEPFPNIKILFLEGGRGAIWQSTIDKVQSIICVFFWRKNATENFQSFLFLTVNSRIHFWWLFLPSMLKSSKF